jgi:hypothetical protein
MTGYGRESKGVINPVKLADDTIFALSSIERGIEVDPEALREGIDLCDYLIKLLEESECEREKESKLTFRSIYHDRKALRESGIDRQKLSTIKGWISDLLNDASSHTPEEIGQLQKVFVDATMTMWQNRTIEFREKKLRRGFIISG